MYIFTCTYIYTYIRIAYTCTAYLGTVGVGDRVVEAAALEPHGVDVPQANACLVFTVS